MDSNTNNNSEKKVYFIYRAVVPVFKIRINVVILANSEKCVSLSVKVTHDVVLEVVNNGNRSQQYKEGYTKVEEILKDLKGNIKKSSL